MLFSSWKRKASKCERTTSDEFPYHFYIKISEWTLRLEFMFILLTDLKIYWIQTIALVLKYFLCIIGGGPHTLSSHTQHTSRFLFNPRYSCWILTSSALAGMGDDRRSSQTRLVGLHVTHPLSIRYRWWKIRPDKLNNIYLFRFIMATPVAKVTLCGEYSLNIKTTM